MSLFEFFFPEQAQASHLRRLADQQDTLQKDESAVQETIETNSFRIHELEQRVTDLERDLGFVSLLLAGFLKTIENKDYITRAEVCAVMEQLDVLDMFRDGRMSVDALKKWARQQNL